VTDLVFGGTKYDYLEEQFQLPLQNNIKTKYETSEFLGKQRLKGAKEASLFLAPLNCRLYWPSLPVTTLASRE